MARLALSHAVSVTFEQNGGVSVFQAINDIWELIHKGNSPQSSKFAANVMRTLDKDGYLVKMTGVNSFDFIKETRGR